MMIKSNFQLHHLGESAKNNIVILATINIKGEDQNLLGIAKEIIERKD